MNHLESSHLQYQWLKWYIRVYMSIYEHMQCYLISFHKLVYRSKMNHIGPYRRYIQVYTIMNCVYGCLLRVYQGIFQYIHACNLTNCFAICCCHPPSCIWKKRDAAILTWIFTRQENVRDLLALHSCSRMHSWLENLRRQRWIDDDLAIARFDKRGCGVRLADCSLFIPKRMSAKSSDRDDTKLQHDFPLWFSRSRIQSA